jgi:GT2 family glycosyltransferase
MNARVTVNILSFNRKAELRNTLQKVYEQAYPNIQVIVVDNNSNDGSAKMVMEEFPSVLLVSLEKNTGIAGWNEGFKVAEGEFILVLDDDSYPAPQAIELCITSMQENSQCGIVACRIMNTKTHTYANFLKINDIPYEFIGCGALLRKSMLDRVGFFSNVLFIYLHELEFSLRMIDAGYIIVEQPKAIVYHNVSSINRVAATPAQIDKRKIFYDTQNIIYILIKYFGLSLIGFKLTRIIAGRLYVGVRGRCFWTVVKGVKSGLHLVWKESPHTARVNPSTQKKYLYGRFGGGFFFEYSSYGNPRPRWLNHKYFKYFS